MKNNPATGSRGAGAGAQGSKSQAPYTPLPPFSQLTSEWLALPGLGPGDRQHLSDFGIAREAIHRAGGLARARIKTTCRVWEPDFAGFPAVVMPIWGGPAPSIYQAVERPQLADLIAWRSAEPQRWWYRVGAYGAVLGADNLDLAHTEGWPITFETTPLDWLRADCRGAVLLEECEADWRVAA